MVEVPARRFRLRALVLGLAFLCAGSCGKSSDERVGAGDPDAGASGDAGDAGDAGVGGTGQGGSAPSGGDSGSSTGGSSSGGDGGLGGDGGSSTGGRAGASGAGGGGNGGAGGTAGAGGSGGNGGASGTGGSGGGEAASYATCQFGSGIARTVIAKRDSTRDRCVVLVLSQPGSNTLGLALPMSWGVESAFYSTPVSADCLIRGPASGAVAAESGSGTVTRTTGFIFDVDVTLFFPGGIMEDLEATGLDASRSCQF